MATSRNKQLWYLWLARDERQPQPKNQDELEPYGRLHVFYDSQLGREIPHYMFPELEEGCCQKFIGMIGDLENNLPKALELINANDIKK